jgi:hypothetical protein
LFKCPWRNAHLKAIAAETKSPDGRRRAFEAFLTEIGTAGIAQCPYHELDWAAAADFTCRQFGGRVYDPERLTTAARDAGLGTAAVEGIWEFFSEPVWIDGSRLGNGQHRSCAMRVSGGASCPVER